MQLMAIIIVWLIIGFFISVYDHLILHTSNSLGTSDEYSFLISVARNMGAGLIGALLGGSFLVFFVNVKYQDKPYGITILAVSLSFIFVVAFITVVMGVILVPVRTGKPLTDPVSIAAFKNFLTDTHPIKNGLAWAFVVAVTQLLLQVNSKFGQDAFWNIIRGKYNTPKEEKRIFMFLDINSSTAIAERLGDETYHALLKDFFADITEPILSNKGNIYQYVGDEVVVSWKYEDGIENLHCISCFFDMKFLIHKMEAKYLQRYGLVPSFKAGIHYGKVVAGEVGIIKRDITYSGDVLNTTSRIQNMCKEFKTEVIASNDLTEKLGLLKKYRLQPLGSIKLRGKEKELLLNAIELSV
jgi:adenylate cyclase